MHEVRLQVSPGRLSLRRPGETNRGRSGTDLEYELPDTGAFSDDPYFDVVVEYGKAGSEDILMKVTAWNRGPEAAVLHMLPTLSFRNDWAPWLARPAEKPLLRQVPGPDGCSVMATSYPVRGSYFLYCEGDVPLLFVKYKTNEVRLQLDHGGGADPKNRIRLLQMPEILGFFHPTGPDHLGVADRGIFALANPERLRRILSKVLDEDDFLSPYGIRSLSRFHERHPHWRDHILFYEFFHGDNGAGLGASHQTGWTGRVASLLHLFGRLEPRQMPEAGKEATFARQDIRT